MTNLAQTPAVSDSDTKADFITVQFPNGASSCKAAAELAGQVLADEEETVEVELVPALEGISAREALRGILDKRGLCMDTVQVFLEGSNTPLPLKASHASSFFLGGQRIFIKS